MVASILKRAFEVQLPIYAKVIREDTKLDVQEQLRGVTLAVKFRFAYYIAFGKPRLTLGIDYVQGLSNLYNDNLEQKEHPEYARTKSMGLRFMVGVEYPIGKGREER